MVEKKQLNLINSINSINYISLVACGVLDIYEWGVYVYLKSLDFNNLGYSYPSTENIETNLNISKDKLFKVLNSLEEKGLISREKRYRNNGKQAKSNKYIITPIYEITDINIKSNVKNYLNSLNTKNAKSKNLIVKNSDIYNEYGKLNISNKISFKNYKYICNKFNKVLDLNYLINLTNLLIEENSERNVNDTLNNCLKLYDIVTLDKKDIVDESAYFISIIKNKKLTSETYYKKMKSLNQQLYR